MQGYIEQLLQIFNGGAVWDGDLISKPHRDELEKAGFIERVMGWNITTAKGCRYVIEFELSLASTRAANTYVSMSCSSLQNL